ncbi:hypothetical protein DV702_16550 [Sporosarcina sp. PTS2304]|uniref:hypothetical protein n=1 Tax=Sporosarcina sp. PTS2304 TaxID=2283194 RepID=UPI000E0D6E5A|nr:hypothetical protein [Sporosarcina sp. PTS2304]AXI01188.1 hypothetical protein DV702_16550 [Sporosarcina sp. PTS2304]
MITLTFTVSEQLKHLPIVTIAGKSASVINTDGFNYSATYTTTATETQGTATITKSLEDITGNASNITTINTGAVTIDTIPVLVSGDYIFSGSRIAHLVGATPTLNYSLIKQQYRCIVQLGSTLADTKAQITRES